MDDGRMLSMVLVRAIVAAIVLASTVTADAQTRTVPEVAISLRGIASWQPVDDTYVGLPYLDEGLGGIGPGVALGVDVTQRRFVFAFEYSWAAIDVTQTGRLVRDGSAEGQLRDALFSFLAGASTWSSPKATFSALAGLSILHGQPRQNGVPVDVQGVPGDEDQGAIAFTAGADFARTIGRRIDFVAGARYSVLPRSQRAKEVGVGPHMLRFGGGVRIRLTERG